MAKPAPVDFETAFAPGKPTFLSLPQWYELGGHCSQCEREGRVDRWEFARTHGDETVIAELRPALRCRKCGNKGSDTWTATQVPR